MGSFMLLDFSEFPIIQRLRRKRTPPKPEPVEIIVEVETVST